MATAAVVSEGERLASLEHEVQTLRAQLESERINAEQASLAIEERYSKLADEYGKACSAKEASQAECVSLRDELQIQKRENTTRDVRIVELEKEVERKRVEVRELHTDKRGVLQLLDQRKREIGEKNETIKQYLDKLVSMTSEKSEIDSKFRESQQDQNRTEAMQARLTQENALLKQHNEWLNEELTTKSSVLLEDRKKSSMEIVDLKTKVVDLETILVEKKRNCESVEKQLEEHRGKLEAAEEQCLQLKQKISTQEALFEKEIGTAKRLINLYQETSDKGTGKIKELEGIVEELQKHMQDTTRLSEEKVKKAEEKTREVEEKCKEYKAQVDRTVEAASQGMTPRLSSPGAIATPSSAAKQLKKTGDSAIQMLELSPAAAAATMMKEGMSLPDMYTKYVEMSDAWRQERSEKKKIQGYLDTILDELERKAPLINEQKAEYERLMDSHDALTKRLEDAMNERHTLESTISKAKSDVQRATRERKAIEQQAADLSRQVQVLVKEVEDMKAGRALIEGAAQPPSSVNGVVGASNVITDHLVEFKNIQELQEQNKRLLVVARQLGDDNEQKLSDMKKSLEAEHLKQIEEYKSQIDKVNSQRQQLESVMQQIVRQRDLYKSLLSDKESDKVNGSFAGQALGKLTDTIQDHKSTYLELQKEYEKFKTENAKNLQMLRNEVYKYREEAGIARGEKTQMQAQMEFERERLTRLNEICTSQGKEIEGLVQKNANLIQRNTQYEQKLKDVSFDLDVSKDDLRREAERNVSLQAEKDLLEKSEKRLSEEVTVAVAEKHRQQASLDSLIQRYSEQEKNWIKERERILSENQKMQESWAGAQKQLLEESNRGRDALSVSTNLAADTAARIATLEVELKSVTKDKDDFQRKLNSATSKVDSLQASLQKAEEKAALAVMRSATRAHEASQNVAASGGSESDVISKLKAQLKVAQSDASNAQEAAAAAAGHLAQYKAMCAASDEALKAMKEAHEGYKQEAAIATEATEKEVEQIKQKLTEAEAEVSKKRGVDAEEEKKRLAQEEVLISENSKLKEETGTLKKQLELNEQQVSTLKNDVKEYHQQWRTAKTLYDNELIAHASDVKMLSTTEEEIEKLKKSLQQTKAEYNECQVALKEAESKLQSEKVSLQADTSSLQSKLEELKKQNLILHEELEKLTSGKAEGTVQLEENAGGEIQKVVQYLRKEKETADCQLSLIQQENVRLRKQMEHALKKADEVSSRLEAQMKKSQEQTNLEQKHSHLLEKVEQLNLLRESNAGLRDENEKMQSKIKKLHLEKTELDSELLPMKEKLNEMQALLDSKDDEVKSIKEQSSRWETRTQSLLDKYGQVDLGEYERVCKALKEAEKSKSEIDAKVEEAVKSANAESDKKLAELKEGLAKAQKQETIAKKQIFNVFNPTRLSIPQWISERDSTKKKIEDMEKKIEGMSSDNTSKAAQSSKVLEEEKSKTKKFELEIESLKKENKLLENTLEESKQAKNNLQVKVLDKLKKAKELKEKLTQKVKDLEKKLKLKQAEVDKMKEEVVEEEEEEEEEEEVGKSKDFNQADEHLEAETVAGQSEAAKDDPNETEQTAIGTKRAIESPGEKPKKRSKLLEEEPNTEVPEKAEEEEKEEENVPADGEQSAMQEESKEVAKEEEIKVEVSEEAKEAAEEFLAKQASLNPLAQPFTPTKAESEPEKVEDEPQNVQQEEVEAQEEAMEEEHEDEEEEDVEGDLEQGEEGREETEAEDEKDTDIEQEDEEAEDKIEDKAADEEPKQSGEQDAQRSRKRAAISWKGGKKSRAKGKAVVSKETVAAAKKVAAAATRGGKTGIRGKKIAKKTPKKKAGGGKEAKKGGNKE